MKRGCMGQKTLSALQIDSIAGEPQLVTMLIELIPSFMIYNTYRLAAAYDRM